MKNATSRLQALDLLRGLDMLLLVVIGPLVMAYHYVWGLPEGVLYQFQHAPWEGLRIWDLIMPWFIFMTGAAIPFSLPKYCSDGKPTRTFWIHLLKRMALLWIFGMLVQGNLLSLNLDWISPYNNTLQAIAMGYLIATLVWLIPWRKLQLAIPVILAFTYGLLLKYFGDYTLQGNLAVRVDSILLPMNHDGYGWTLTSMMFGVMALCGMFCTQLLKSCLNPYMKCFSLSGLGLLLLGGGMLLSLWEPAIKRIYTVSFTAQALGWGMLTLALLYLIADILKLRFGQGMILLFGRHSLLAYLCGTLFAPIFATAAQLFTQGCPHLFGSNVQPFIQTSVSCLFIILLLTIYDQNLKKLRCVR